MDACARRPFLGIIKDIAMVALLVSATALSVEGYLLVREARSAVKIINDGARQIIRDAGESMKTWKDYNISLSKQINDPQVQRGFGLLMRSGDDIAATVKKANNTLEGLNDAIRITSDNLNSRLLPGALLAINRTSDSINGQVIPQLVEVEAETARTIAGTRDQLDSIRLELLGSLGAVRVGIDRLNERISDPSVSSSMDSIASATRSIDRSAHLLETKAAQLAKPARWLWRVAREAIVIGGRIVIP